MSRVLVTATKLKIVKAALGIDKIMRPGMKPKPRYGRGAVLPPGFTPIYVDAKNGKRKAMYRCMSRQKDLQGEMRQCCWVGKKDRCIRHVDHCYDLSPEDDPMFHPIEQTPLTRAKLNQRIQNYAVEFTGLTNLSCRQAASSAMNDFVRNVFQLGLSYPRESLEQVIDAGQLIDPFTDKSIAKGLVERAEEKYRVSLNELADLKFVNLIVDAGTVQQLKNVPCLLSSPHASQQPILLELRENQGMTKEDYTALFCDLVVRAESEKLTLCSIIIDNLAAQSFGLDAWLSSSNSPIIHVKCFAHMANLVIANTLGEGNFARVMRRVTNIQTCLRKRQAVAAIGKRCPAFVQTRWIYMIDTLAFIFNNLEAIRGYMFANPHESQDFDDIPTEVFELYAVLLPFSCFIRAVEARCCSLTSIVPLARDLLKCLSNVRGFLATDAGQVILRDLHIRLLARLCVNNRAEVLAAHSLTLEGRDELRKMEVGYSTQGQGSGDGLRGVKENQDLKSFMKGDASFDDVMASIYQQIANSRPFIGAECAPSVFSQRVGGMKDMYGHSLSDAQNYTGYLREFAEMTEDERFDVKRTDIYGKIYDIAQERILQLADRVAQKLQYDAALPELKRRYDIWLFDPQTSVPFIGAPNPAVRAEQMWRMAHRHAGWEILADVALRIVSSGTSEADAERILSMERNIAGLHGTRFGIQGMRSRMILARKATTGLALPHRRIEDDDETVMSLLEIENPPEIEDDNSDGHD
jgi:hypothetical protein